MTDSKDMAGASREHAEDLSALARRQALSEAEQRRLGLCLASSDALRVLHDIGCDFDALDTARPGDTELVARIAARGKKRAQARGRVRSVPRRGLALWVGGAIVLGGALAAAATVLGIVGPPSPEPSSYGVRSTEPAAPVTDRAAPRRAKSPEPGDRGTGDPMGPAVSLEDAAQVRPKSALPLHAASSAPAAAGHRALPEQDASSAEATLDDAAGLFSLANGARRRGAIDESVGIYQRLQARFPRSPEAVLSHVLVGRLQLGRGKSTLALAEFGHYLRAEPRGALAQEALEGKARALGRLGRVEEERAAYQELLSRYPNSIYAREARERLGGSD
jgi:hypothetical protein